MEKDNVTSSKMKEVPSASYSGKNYDENGITILDALAASGLRSIRYWKEIPGVKHVTINDLDGAATKRAMDNLHHNGLDHVLLTDNIDRQFGICVHHGDATHEMYLSRKKTQPPPRQQQQQDLPHHNNNNKTFPTTTKR
jgi:tRNA G26 N,N-dimethylase Trm1